MDFYNFLASSSGIAPPSLETRRKDYKDFPCTFDYTWLLGNKFSIIHHIEDIRSFIRSKIWFSYRKDFPPIGTTYEKKDITQRMIGILKGQKQTILGGMVLNKDTHWGCMLRCGQMVMAEALIRRHLGRGWKWNPEAQDPVYLKILSMFQDKKDALYSIHQIAQMGVSEGKRVGQWFGPNTIAQVLRKLSTFDEWSSVVVHVALDNAVVIEDVKSLCRHSAEPLALTCNNHHLPVVKDPSGMLYLENVSRQKIKWRPMLLFVPLRLGLTNLNPIYSQSLKNTFTMRQSLGMVGGKPSHALWFIGYVGNELVYLDPHTTQPYVNFDDEILDDSSYHIRYGRSQRMIITDIDPSVALAFYFDSEDDFDHWCQSVVNILMTSENQVLFELSPKRPQHWPPLELQPDISSSASSSEFYFVEGDCRVDDSDDDFEIFDPVFPSRQRNCSNAQESLPK